MKEIFHPYDITLDEPQDFRDLVDCVLHGLGLNGTTIGFRNTNPIYNQFTSANYTLLIQSFQGTFMSLISPLQMLILNLLYLLHFII